MLLQRLKPKGATYFATILAWSAPTLALGQHHGGGGGHSGGASHYGGGFHGGGNYHGGSYNHGAFNHYYPSYHQYYGGNYYPRYFGGFYNPGFYGYSSPYSYGNFYYTVPDAATYYYYPQTIDSTSVSGYYSPYSATAPAPTAIKVVVPTSDAKIWFADREMQSQGTVRNYSSPPLERGKDFQYEIRARWLDSGIPTEQKRAVTVRAGQETLVDFTRAMTADPAASSGSRQ